MGCLMFCSLGAGRGDGVAEDDGGLEQEATRAGGIPLYAIQEHFYCYHADAIYGLGYACDRRVKEIKVDVVVKRDDGYVLRHFHVMFPQCLYYSEEYSV